MSFRRSRHRIAGWLVAGMAALGLLGSAAAFALAAERRTSLLVLDLATRPPAAPAIAAVAEASPEVVPAEPVLPEAAEPVDLAPVVPDGTRAPLTDASAPPPTLPEADAPVTPDLSLEQPEREPVETLEKTLRPMPRPAKTIPASATDPKLEKTPEKPRGKKAASEKSASAASAPSSGATAKGGDLSPAAYAKAVLKKVRSTRKQLGTGKGTVVVGFTIDPSGGLASVQVLKSSGIAALDAVAVDHIHRSAPFPAPPSNANLGYSFEFVGK